jgi:hypothetical protein
LLKHSDQILTWNLIILWSFSVKYINLCTKYFGLNAQFIYELISTQQSDSIMSDLLHFRRIFMNILFLHTTGAASSKYWWENTCVIPKKNLRYFWKSSKLFPQADKSFRITLNKSRIYLKICSSYIHRCTVHFVESFN